MIAVVFLKSAREEEFRLSITILGRYLLEFPRILSRRFGKGPLESFSLLDFAGCRESFDYGVIVCWVDD